MENIERGKIIKLPGKPDKLQMEHNGYLLENAAYLVQGSYLANEWKEKRVGDTGNLGFPWRRKKIQKALLIKQSIFRCKVTTSS